MGAQAEARVGFSGGSRMPQPHQRDFASGAWAQYKPRPVEPLPLDHESQRRHRETGVTRGYHNNRPDEDNKVAYNGQTCQFITPVSKQSSSTHPSVTGRSYEDCLEIWKVHGIKYESIGCYDRIENLPKPVKDMIEASFPKYIEEFVDLRCWNTIFPIQMQAWQAIRGGHDLVASAPTGSGKTMSYVLPLVCRVLAQEAPKPGDGPLGIVILPNRELCSQVLRELGFFQERLRYAVLEGSQNWQEQVKILQNPIDVAVATPGRLSQLLEGKHTNLDRATYFVLDEADLLLGSHNNDSCGMRRQVEGIIKLARPDRQIILCSATLHEDSTGHVADFVKNYLRVSPVRISVGPKLAACKDVEQTFAIHGMSTYWPKEMSKMDCVEQILIKVLGYFQRQKEPEEGLKVIMFCNAKDSIEEAVSQLKAKKFMLRDGLPLKVEGFHSDMRDGRNDVLERFRDLKSGLNVLVGSQALARGHDFPDLQFVINYDYPGGKDGIVDYIHRIGRTGRAGKKGSAVTLLEETDLRFGMEIATMLKASGAEVPGPIADISKRKARELWAAHDKKKDYDPWRGRGKDYYKKKYLLECHGLGIARAAKRIEEA